MTEIDYIELPAEGLLETMEFYRTAFGWDWVEFGPTYAATTSKPLTIALNSLAETCPSPAAEAENGIGPLVLFSTDNLAEASSRIIGAGGEISSEPYPYPGGRRLHFKDPSGNVLGVYQSDTKST